MLMLAVLWLGGCSWVDLAWNALTYPTTRSGELANVVVHNEWAYITKGAAGIEVVYLGRREPAQGALPLDTYGFTPGGAKPANFPIEGTADGSILYLAFAGLGILDVADPSMPKLVALLELDVEPVNVDVHDGLAALVGSSPWPRLVLVDVHEPSHPRILQSIPLPEDSLATGVAIASSHVVVAAHGRGTLLFNRTSNTWELP